MTSSGERETERERERVQDEQEDRMSVRSMAVGSSKGECG